MTRRIAVTMVVLTTVLLVLAVAPLAWSLSVRERVSFQNEQRAATRVIAEAAEEPLSDGQPAALMRRELAAAARAGDCAAVYDTSARLVASTPCKAANGPEAQDLVTDVLAGHEQESSEQEAARLLSAEPAGELRQPAGAVVLARSAAPLNARIAAIWGWAALIGGVGLAASMLLSVRLARWVGRPLSALDRAAQRLGEGALDQRAPVKHGPAEVRRLATTFNTMAARTEALVHGHRAVLADVSHQLRTPLAALRLRLDLLSAGTGGDAAAEVEAAHEEIARLSRLVDGLLAVARAEQVVPQPEPVRIDQVAIDRAAAWRPLALERGIALRPERVVPVTAGLGGGHLAQIFDNLLANALEAVEEGGTIKVGVAAERDMAEVWVVDDGPGMSPDAKATAFRRFGNPKARGSGLGLAIVHRLATANAGSVRLEDTPGGGLTALLSFPLWRHDRGGRRVTGGPPASPAEGAAAASWSLPNLKHS